MIKGTEFGSDVNVGPAISPDGRWIAFLSSRSLFSIDLYVADASTGRILRRLTSTATSPRFSSLQFSYSAGAWDSASRRLAIATVSSGRERRRVAPHGSPAQRSGSAPCQRDAWPA